MESEYLKAAELRGYGRGYQAGKRRKDDNIRREVMERKRRAFWQRAFLAALPAAFTAEHWVRGDKPINTLEQRIRLAVETADEATKQAFRNL